VLGAPDPGARAPGPRDDRGRPADEDESAGAERYAEIAANAVLAAGGGAVTAVGHSLAGLVIPLLPALVDVDELVFLCSPLPAPGRSLWEQLEDDPDIFVAGSVQPAARDTGQVVEATEEYAIRTYFHDCPDEVARSAAGRLRRQSTKATTEPSPVQTWPPTVRCRYVLGGNDRILNPEWSRREAPRRLGVEPIELDTGHSPFLARPAELADALAS
jgi:pimeloyl-ACP methyl ester carboxylesterase